MTYPHPDPQQLAVIREVLALVPSNCSWLLPIRDDDGDIVDWVTQATSGSSVDIAGRDSDQRMGVPLSAHYPGLVGGQIWQVYGEVLRGGEPRTLPGFVYEETLGGVSRRSVYDLAVRRLRGGVLVAWQRVDEVQRRLDQTELLGNLGWGEYDLLTGVAEWSPGMYRIFERDPALGPMSRLEQTAGVLPEDRMLRDAAWQAFEEGQQTDITVRVRVGETIKHLRVLADVDHDANGKPLKIYGLVQDVTVLESSLSELAQVSGELLRQERTLLAEHRVAAQLQEIILPLPDEPFDLSRLRVLVRYLPAERTSRIGGDWYLATTDESGGAVLGVGDVAGHGLAAATAMAQLRYALTGWIATGTSDPGELMSNLNRLSLRLGITGTAIIAHVDAGTGVLTWAQAGHPAPLTARDGAATELDRPPGMLLGTLASSEYPTRTMTLSGGDLLLFYTDGLIEYGSEDPGIRLDHVREVLAGISAAGHGQPLAQLQTVLQYANPDDDTCLLALRLLTS